jgi:predicted regulator of Ras-like GTPase activity (Roadblock/LC7/MglB family)
MPVPVGPKPQDAADTLQLSLAGIVAKLPDALKQKVASHTGTVGFSKRLALQQLSGGSVKITYADLRQLAPSGALLAAGDLEQTMVELPLGEVVKGLGAAAFNRRTDQKVIAIPDEVQGLFGAKGAPVAAPKTTVIGMAPVESTPAPKAAPAPVTPKPVPAPAPAIPKPVPAPTPAVPKPVPAPAPAAPTPSPAPAPAQEPEKATPIAVNSDLLKQMTAAAGGKPAAPMAPAAPAKPAAPMPAPAVPKPAAAAPAAVAAPAGLVAVPVAQVSEAWPDAVKSEVKLLGLQQVLVPTDELGRGLKFGKVAFTWKQLLGWTNAALTTQQAAATVELPLRVVAPLFLASNKPSATQKKVVVPDSIPDMFAGKGTMPAAAPAAAPTPVVAAPAPVPAVAKVAPVAGPSEAVQRACKLAGVAGALVASEDGLSVAAQLPASLKADNVAAFVPQMFSRLTQYAKDLGAGSVSRMTFVSGDATWQISKGGTVYLVVVSKAGAALPAAEVEALANELVK